MRIIFLILMAFAFSPAYADEIPKNCRNTGMGQAC